MAFFQSVMSLHMSVLTGIRDTSDYEELNEVSDKSSDIDRGWAFVVATFSFIAHIFIFGPSWSYGILYITFLEEFEELPSVTAWVGTISASVTLLGGPLGSLVVNRYGNRVAMLIGCALSTIGLILSSLANGIYFLYITFGVISGIGWSIAYIPMITILGEYFDRYRKLAIGCSCSGTGMGQFVYPQLFTILINQYHWRGALLITAAINLNLLVSAAIFMPPRLSPRQYMEQQRVLQEKKRKAALKDDGITSSVISLDGKDAKISAKAYLKNLFQLDVFQSPHFILMVINNILFGFAASIVFTHLSNFAKSYHHHETFSSTLISIIGGMNFIGRISVGFILQYLKLNVIGTSAIFYFISGVVILIGAFVHNSAAFLTMATVFGFFSAVFGPAVPLVAIYICGIRRLASAYGYLLASQSVGFVLGGPAGGWVLESFKDYDGCFVMAGVAAIISALCMMPSWYLIRRYRGIADAGPADTEDGAEP